jgi:hypothetical protein
MARVFGVATFWNSGNAPETLPEFRNHATFYKHTEGFSRQQRLSDDA